MSILTKHTAVLITVITLGFFVIRRWLRQGTGPSLPPGPKPLPLVGNIFDLPPENGPEYRHWLTFKDTYGPVSSVTVMGRTIVILHDQQAAKQLLSQMSSKTSGRPRLEFADMCGFSELPVCHQYDDALRRCRKLMHQSIGTEGNASHCHETMEMETQRFLLRAMDTPENLWIHFRTLTSAIILKETYGYSIDVEQKDPMVQLIEKYMTNFSKAYTPKAWLIDMIPHLRHLPDILPGMSFKKTAQRMRMTSLRTANVPYAFVQHQIKVGLDQPSFTSSFIQQHGKSGPDSIEEQDIKNSALGLFAGGADTTIATLKAFALAMVKFPDVQRKAQQEIDRVVGPDRLPKYKDRASLPYVDDIVSEALRWSPVGSLGIPRTTSEELTYDGHLIPKGSIILPNLWWFTHDPKDYSDPDSFRPERYRPPFNEPDPSVVFGYGLRACPGRFFAHASLFVNIAQMLSVFDFSKATDEHGVEKEPRLEVVAGLVSYPKDYPFKMRPRDDGKADLVRKVNAGLKQKVNTARLGEMSDAGYFKECLRSDKLDA
ncbi:hypothetical protein CDD80_2010 [Ophiocordyceps camponoti-rufipedis]|uniref:O-methylsterigmatocystin oxidoreductase n=1 Tax=Ophiocordyceps camponoti-rufipedis TaxID=2004952 RepID=A0A2C5Z900_9HYPO|nr:hypothetical protein CDD80_2010 [Ophiocordyceps camponoti-rufipedis]